MEGLVDALAVAAKEAENLRAKAHASDSLISDVVCGVYLLYVLF